MLEVLGYIVLTPLAIASAYISVFFAIGFVKGIRDLIKKK